MNLELQNEIRFNLKDKFLSLIYKPFGYSYKITKYINIIYTLAQKNRTINMELIQNHIVQINYHRVVILHLNNKSETFATVNSAKRLLDIYEYIFDSIDLKDCKTILHSLVIFTKRRVKYDEEIIHIIAKLLYKLYSRAKEEKQVLTSNVDFQTIITTHFGDFVYEELINSVEYKKAIIKGIVK